MHGFASGRGGEGREVGAGAGAVYSLAMLGGTEARLGHWWQISSCVGSTLLLRLRTRDTTMLRGEFVQNASKQNPRTTRVCTGRNMYQFMLLQERVPIRRSHIIAQFCRVNASVANTFVLGRLGLCLRFSRDQPLLRKMLRFPFQSYHLGCRLSQDVRRGSAHVYSGTYRCDKQQMKLM